MKWLGYINIYTYPNTCVTGVGGTEAQVSNVTRVKRLGVGEAKP